MLQIEMMPTGIWEKVLDKPLWFAISVLMIISFVYTVTKVFPVYFDKRSCEDELNRIRQSVKNLKEEHLSDKERYRLRIEQMQEELNKFRDEYNKLIGEVGVIKRYYEKKT